MRLRSGSPCIDAGDNTAVPISVTKDLLGNPRFFDDPGTLDTGLGPPPIVDMGAYEVGTTTTFCVPGDFDCDGDVDLADFLTFQLGFFGAGIPSADARTDLDRDGDTDLADLLILQAAFTGAR